MALLVLRDEKSKESWQVWPIPELIPSGRIQETGSYLFELSDVADGSDSALLIDEIELEGLRPTESAVARWRWQLSFHAGTVAAELRCPGLATQRFEVIIDPDRRKLSRSDFDTMVREILDDTFALFSLSSFRKSIAHGVGNKPPPIARLEFLRSRIIQLEEVVQSIVRAPRQTLTAEDTQLPYHRAVRASGSDILRSMRSGRVLKESHAGPSRLPAVLNGFLPERIRIRQRRSSLDLLEHRQMGACLRAWAGWLSDASTMLARVSRSEDNDLRPLQAVWASRCTRLSRRMAMMAALPPFAEAGEAPAYLVLSSLFRRDPMYRQFFRLWQDINLGIASVFGDFLEMPLARTYELYELWCFLRLVRAGVEKWGTEGLETTDLFISEAVGGVTLKREAVTVPIGSGWKLCFQKQYREFWKESDGLGSYSRVMIPDIVVSGSGVGSAPCLIVLDAKYRIEEGLPDALNSIHTYKDALVREVSTSKVEGIVNAAYLLAPQLPGTTGAYRSMPMPGRLFHPEYRKNFRFGAISLRPGMSLVDISKALDSVVADAIGG